MTDRHGNKCDVVFEKGRLTSSVPQEVTVEFGDRSGVGGDDTASVADEVGDGVNDLEVNEDDAAEEDKESGEPHSKRQKANEA